MIYLHILEFVAPFINVPGGPAVAQRTLSWCTLCHSVPVKPFSPLHTYK